MTRIVNKREAMKKAKECAIALLLRLDLGQFYGEDYYNSLNDSSQIVADDCRREIIKRIEKRL